jgi:1-phosphatidylinositol-4-phosphate 5-kinase
MVFRAGEGAGASGSFFFFSKDNRLLIKTLQRAEKKILLGMLDSYYSHLEQTQNRSLIARIYGVFTFRTNHFSPLDIIVMENTAQLTDKKQRLGCFDLKGSIINRKSAGGS